MDYRGSVGLSDNKQVPASSTNLFISKANPITRRFDTVNNDDNDDATNIGPTLIMSTTTPDTMKMAKKLTTVTNKARTSVFGCDKLDHLLSNILCINIKCKTNPVRMTFHEEGIRNYNEFARVDITTFQRLYYTVNHTKMKIRPKDITVYQTPHCSLLFTSIK